MYMYLHNIMNIQHMYMYMHMHKHVCMHTHTHTHTYTHSTQTHAHIILTHTYTRTRTRTPHTNTQSYSSLNTVCTSNHVLDMLYLFNLNVVSSCTLLFFSSEIENGVLQTFRAFSYALFPFSRHHKTLPYG